MEASYVERLCADECGQLVSIKECFSGLSPCVFWIDFVCVWNGLCIDWFFLSRSILDRPSFIHSLGLSIFKRLCFLRVSSLLISLLILVHSPVWISTHLFAHFAILRAFWWSFASIVCWWFEIFLTDVFTHLGFRLFLSHTYSTLHILWIIGCLHSLHRALSTIACLVRFYLVFRFEHAPCLLVKETETSSPFCGRCDACREENKTHMLAQHTHTHTHTFLGRLIVFLLCFFVCPLLNFFFALLWHLVRSTTSIVMVLCVAYNMLIISIYLGAMVCVGVFVVCCCRCCCCSVVFVVSESKMNWNKGLIMSFVFKRIRLSCCCVEWMPCVKCDS